MMTSASGTFPWAREVAGDDDAAACRRPVVFIHTGGIRVSRRVDGGETLRRLRRRFLLGRLRVEQGGEDREAISLPVRRPAVAISFRAFPVRRRQRLILRVFALGLRG